ncbi:hypothetical protein Ocin01_16409 [Orchesella cincta]|uniref:Uncharacterized protein n=1 Tax=Orchesella cincta TaxID=48709 RepID=A0A1D2MBD4_ORCCI|nr:hypothetical protein Ocin01_16409 [Orchesella cincta]
MDVSIDFNVDGASALTPPQFLTACGIQENAGGSWGHGFGDSPKILWVGIVSLMHHFEAALTSLEGFCLAWIALKTWNWLPKEPSTFGRHEVFENLNTSEEYNLLPGNSPESTRRLLSACTSAFKLSQPEPEKEIPASDHDGGTEGVDDDASIEENDANGSKSSCFRQFVLFRLQYSFQNTMRMSSRI